VFHPISVSPYLVPLPPGDDPIAVTVIIMIIIIIIKLHARSTHSVRTLSHYNGDSDCMLQRLESK
jgi:hypothetical protein